MHPKHIMLLLLATITLTTTCMVCISIIDSLFNTHTSLSLFHLWDCLDGQSRRLRGLAQDSSVDIDDQVLVRSILDLDGDILVVVLGNSEDSLDLGQANTSTTSLVRRAK